MLQSNKFLVLTLDLINKTMLRISQHIEDRKFSESSSPAWFRLHICFSKVLNLSAVYCAICFPFSCLQVTLSSKTSCGRSQAITKMRGRDSLADDWIYRNVTISGAWRPWSWRPWSILALGVWSDVHSGPCPAPCQGPN